MTGSFKQQAADPRLELCCTARGLALHLNGCSQNSKCQKGQLLRNVDWVQQRQDANAKLLEMPIEILLQIFKDIRPHDLLNLSRASNTLRVILLSPCAEFVWRNAREGFVPATPPCPLQLSEPEFANLLFGSECYICGCKCPDRQLYHWFCFKRICHSCEKDHVSESLDFLAQVPNVQEPPTWLLNSESEYLPAFIQFDSAQWRRKYFKAEVTEAILTYNSLETEEEREKWAANQLNIVKQRREFASQCSSWYVKHLVNEVRYMKTYLHRQPATGTSRTQIPG